MNFSDPILSTILKAVFFPLLFQAELMSFAWGAGEQSWMLVTKRVFLPLPAGALLLACWASIASVLSIPIRRNRQEFIERNRCVLGPDPARRAEIGNAAFGRDAGARERNDNLGRLHHLAQARRRSVKVAHDHPSHLP